MKIKEVTFVKSVFIDSEEVMFDDKKEVIFVWRSNVGKSSIMNSLFNKKDLVKTSAKPGKTKTANIFLVNKKYYFTDLPGYWFAKLWAEAKEKLDALISWYLEARASHIKRVYMLIDTKIWAQQTDLDMYQFILDLWLPVSIILSKIDRLWSNDVRKSFLHSEKDFFWQKIFPVSAHKNEWLKELIVDIDDAVK